ncbi:hypothetical protein CALCODRAFT_262531 [Calocera cornea HHB12733]|uniref:Uncharacterized protein n=1 Tax=Calocera cornea HHB12733 TaxID=1353952 RepID=A0A165GFJ2_9BASI|nr:hypothetical protein CALCODRAFT_262531 [Calocera cornea HHB12733]
MDVFTVGNDEDEFIPISQLSNGSYMAILTRGLLCDLVAHPGPTSTLDSIKAKNGRGVKTVYRFPSSLKTPSKEKASGKPVPSQEGESGRNGSKGKAVGESGDNHRSGSVLKASKGKEAGVAGCAHDDASGRRGEKAVGAADGDQEGASVRKALEETVVREVQPGKDDTSKVEKKISKKEQKARLKALKSLNKLVTRKDDTLPDIVVEMCSALVNSSEFSPIAAHLRSTIIQKSPRPGEEGWPIRIVNKLDPPNSIRWRRRITTRYDERAHQFVPLDKSESRLENARLLYMRMDQLYDGLKQGTFEKTVRRLRDKLGEKALLFAMIGPGNCSRDVEARLTMMMMEYHLNVIRVDGPQDAATRLYNLTANFSFKPHRQLAKAHLPNIGDTKLSSGSNAHDTYFKILLQVHRMTESAAQGIMQQYPTLYSLMFAYESIGWKGEHLLEDILVSKHTYPLNSLK